MCVCMCVCIYVRACGYVHREYTKIRLDQAFIKTVNRNILTISDIGLIIELDNNDIIVT